MLFLIVLFAAVNVFQCEKTCKAPNGTESNFVWIPCSGGPIIYHNIKLMDANCLFFINKKLKNYKNHFAL